MKNRKTLQLISRLVLTGCLAMAVTTVTVYGQGNKQSKGGKAARVPVIVTHEDRVGDRIKSDGVAYEDGVGGVEAYLNSAGNLIFGMDSDKSGRKRFLDFTVPATAPSCAATGECQKDFETALVGGFMRVDALAGMAPGESAAVEAQVGFADPGGRPLQWFLRFDPSDQAGTNNVAVTCTTPAGSTECDSWTVEANDPSSIAKLLSAPTRGRFEFTDEGNYFMPFKLTVVKK